VSQPWLVEAVGTAEWTGTPLRSLLDEAELLDGAVEIVFTGLDHGMEGASSRTTRGACPSHRRQVTTCSWRTR
jgi:DMSO/TMAO reductase YedYZ molybdopterin-dependent catalytic subunit